MLQDLLKELFVLKSKVPTAENDWAERDSEWLIIREFNGRIRFALQETRDTEGRIVIASAIMHCEIDVDIQTDNLVVYGERELQVLSVKKETGALLQEIMLR